MTTHPKVRGLTLDPKLTYSTHIHNISVYAHKPLQIIKTVTATGWGKQKETLTLPIHEHIQLHASQYKQKTEHPSHPLHKHTTYFNTPTLKTHYFLTTAASQQTFPQTPTQSLQQNSEQTNLPSSNHTYTKSTPNHIHHHYTPYAIPTHMTHTTSSTAPTYAPTYAPHCYPWICGYTTQEWWSCWPDGEISRLVDQTRDDRTPPTNKDQGSG